EKIKKLQIPNSREAPNFKLQTEADKSGSKQGGFERRTENAVAADVRRRNLKWQESASSRRRLHILNSHRPEILFLLGFFGAGAFWLGPKIHTGSKHLSAIHWLCITTDWFSDYAVFEDGGFVALLDFSFGSDLINTFPHSDGFG